jgi:hypothetical protein
MKVVERYEDDYMKGVHVTLVNWPSDAITLDPDEYERTPVAATNAASNRDDVLDPLDTGTNVPQ